MAANDEKKMIITRIKIVFVLFLSGMMFPTTGQTGSGISEKNTVLLTLERSRDADEIRYTANCTENGRLDTNEPIKVFWVRKTQNNETEPLTWIQKKHAYGIRITEPYNSVTGNLKFQFVSYPQKTFELRKNGEQGYKVYTIIENSEIEVTRIFVQMEGEGWVPSISYVKIIGYTAGSNGLVAETIIP